MLNAHNRCTPSRAFNVYFLDARRSISGLLTYIRPISNAGMLARCDSAAEINTHTMRSSQWHSPSSVIYSCYSDVVGWKKLESRSCNLPTDSCKFSTAKRVLKSITLSLWILILYAHKNNLKCTHTVHLPAQGNCAAKSTSLCSDRQTSHFFLIWGRKFPSYRCLYSETFQHARI